MAVQVVKNKETLVVQVVDNESLVVQEFFFLSRIKAAWVVVEDVSMPALARLRQSV